MVNFVRRGTDIQKLRTNINWLTFLPFVSKANSDYVGYIKVVCPLVSKADGRIALVYIELKCPKMDQKVLLC